MSKNQRIWVEGTIVAALAMVLSFVPTTIGSSFTISLGQIPLTLFALRRGWKPALWAAFIWGILHFPLGQVAYLSIPQVLLEYPVAFTFAGFAGVTAKQVQASILAKRTSSAVVYLVLGTLSGTAARFFWHFVAGFIFWGAYAMWGMGPVVFSLVMNGISGVMTAAVTVGVLIVVMQMVPMLFIPKEGSLVQTAEK